MEVCGWVNSCRDHGGVIFLDLRDHTGTLQLVANPENESVFQKAQRVRSEYVLRACGRLRIRPEGTANPAIPTGGVELLCDTLEILNESLPPPFQLDDPLVGEDTRMRFRYVDLRQPEKQHNLRMRAQTNHILRGFLESQGFLEIETPMLSKATPEGARDYLVPSRTQSGAFFALPQSPQLFKQLLMVSGMDRYYQIVRCFRDEDLRADRQPEFTQLDIEASFQNESDIMDLTTTLLGKLFQELLSVSLAMPFPRLSYADALLLYGTDRPDLRIALTLKEVGDLMTETEFKVFAIPANDPQGRVAVLKLPGISVTRGEIDALTEWLRGLGASGLAYIKCKQLAAGRDGLQSPILKFIDDKTLEALLARCEAEDGDTLFFGAGKNALVNETMAALRVRLGKAHGFFQEGWHPLWVVGFPLFSYDEQRSRWKSLHHPFTAPVNSDLEALSDMPGAARARAYDVVVNGTELGGGSVRIHDHNTQRTIFKILGMDELEMNNKFGFLLQAFQHGCPPHAGIALGLDRLVMLMVGASSIRDVIAFPKTQIAGCPLTGAPTPVAAEQLRELGLCMSASEKKRGKA